MMNLIVLERLNALSMLCSLFDQILIPQAVICYRDSVYPANFINK